MTKQEIERRIKELERNCCCSLAKYATFAGFPAVGKTDRLYLDLSTGDLYFWDGDSYESAGGGDVVWGGIGGDIGDQTDLNQGYLVRIYQTGTTSFTGDDFTYFKGITAAGAWAANADTPMTDTEKYNYSINIRKATVLNTVEIRTNAGTVGSDEAWPMYIRVNDTTDYLVGTVSLATQFRTWLNEAIDIPLVAGDFITIKTHTPTWATNPASVSTDISLWFDLN